MVWLELLGGAALVAVLYFDIFQSIVLPRPSPAALRPSSLLLEPLWQVCRWLAFHTSSPYYRELLLGTFAPLLIAAMSSVTSA